ncbi:MAG: nickel-responsive transcriptional regulator NikR [Candidatus Bathyarchaeota archaeon]|nr:nickel-responsive transcriptional regulator NikR [Candidatus Bathyarchaeota archaeon]
MISVSLTPDLLERLDSFVEESGYSSRSEAIRLAVRDTLSQYALQRLERGQVVATVTVISDRERDDINSHLMELRHVFEESVFSNMHLHIGGGQCVDIFIVQGLSEVVLDFASRVRAVRGIREVKFTMTPVEGSAP